MSAERLNRTNNGGAIDFRPAGKREKIAPCSIPEWIREIGAVSFNGIPNSGRSVSQLIASAAYAASLEQASFGMTKAADAATKEAVRLYISTWLIPPLVRAMELLQPIEEVAQ